MFLEERSQDRFWKRTNCFLFGIEFLRRKDSIPHMKALHSSVEKSNKINA